MHGCLQSMEVSARFSSSQRIKNTSHRVIVLMFVCKCQLFKSVCICVSINASERKATLCVFVCVFYILFVMKFQLRVAFSKSFIIFQSAAFWEVCWASRHHEALAPGVCPGKTNQNPNDGLYFEKLLRQVTGISRHRWGIVSKPKGEQSCIAFCWPHGFTFANTVCDQQHMIWKGLNSGLNSEKCPDLILD